VSPLVVPVVVTPDFYIGLEVVDGAVFAHTSVYSRWSAWRARVLRAACDGVMVRAGGPVFVASHQPHGGDPVKFGKFARLMGFEFLRTVRGTDGADHAVYVRWS
jgi:hypothetical protein